MGPGATKYGLAVEARRPWGPWRGAMEAWVQWMAEQAERAERAGMHWGPLKSFDWV